MARIYAANNAKSYLAAQINGVVTSLTVTNATGFPDVPFMITVGLEIMKVTEKNVGTGVFTVVRQQEGTNGLTHYEGQPVENRITAGTINTLWGDLIAHEAAASPHSGHAADVHNFISTTNHPVTGLTAGHVVRASGATAYSFAQLSHADLGSVSANQHHNQSHVLATNSALGADHSISGAASGQVLRATSATAANFAQLSHADLGSVSANQHHNQSHVLATNSALGEDHSISGAASGQVLRATSATAARFQQLTHSDLGSVGANDHHSRSHSIDSTSDHASMTANRLIGRGGTAGSPAQLDANSVKNILSLNNVDNVQQIPATEKGANDGVATLDSTGNVPESQLGNVDGMEIHDNTYHSPNFAEEGVRADSELEFRVEVRISDPVSPALGRVWLRSDL